MSYSANQIESITDAIHNIMNTNNDNVINVVDIARQLGFDVYQSSFTADNIDGMVINSPSEKAIYVNQSNSPERQRFTIAHEIGHIVLHHDTEQQYEVIDYRGNNTTYDSKEHEANIFAASLLMPKNKVHQIWNLLLDVDDFAKAFKVSKKAAAIRLDNMELI